MAAVIINHSLSEDSDLEGDLSWNEWRITLQAVLMSSSQLNRCLQVMSERTAKLLTATKWLIFCGIHALTIVLYVNLHDKEIGDGKRKRNCRGLTAAVAGRVQQPGLLPQQCGIMHTSWLVSHAPPEPGMDWTTSNEEHYAS